MLFLSKNSFSYSVWVWEKYFNLFSEIPLIIKFKFEPKLFFIFQKCSRKKRSQVRLQEDDDGTERDSVEHNCLGNQKQNKTNKQ